jgi:hypothetical protein
MASTYTVIQGNTGPLWEVGIDDGSGGLVTLDVNYTCKFVVGSSIDRTITDKDSNRFQVQLTPTETAALDLGRHVCAIEISNSTTTPAPFQKEQQIEILITNDVA